MVVGDLRTGSKRRVSLGKDQYPRSLALSPQGDRLAVGVGVRIKANDFYLDGDEHIEVFDIKGDNLERIAKIRHRGRAEALAWLNASRFRCRRRQPGSSAHTCSGRVAERPRRRIGHLRVAISDKDRYLAFVERRDPNAKHPNRRGTDEWRFLT